jgi:hypothetical protein
VGSFAGLELTLWNKPLSMNLAELKAALKQRTLEFEVALETHRPNKELLVIYKQLKDLQYQMVQEELRQKQSDSSSSVQ